MLLQKHSASMMRTCKPAPTTRLAATTSGRPGIAPHLRSSLVHRRTHFGCPPAEQQQQQTSGRFHPGAEFDAAARADLGRLLLIGSRLRRQPIAASFLGVGAPEAILVAIVALVVFGPKGLAEAAKSVGGALRAFQPTIREVVEVSQDLKGTLERELGLDEIRAAATVAPPPLKPRAAPASTSTSSGGVAAAAAAAGSASGAADEDPDIEAKRAASAAAAWAGSSGGSSAAAASAPPPPPAPPASLDGMSVEQLEAELARRRAAAAPPADQA